MWVADQSGGARIAAVVDELVQREAKGLPHFAVAPVAQARHLKTSCHALRQAARYEQRRRTQNDGPNVTACARVFVPQAFDFFGPAGQLLHFIEHQHAGTGLAGKRTGRFPLRIQPARTNQPWVVGTNAVLGDGLAGAPHRRIDRRVFQRIQGLAHQGGLANLAGPSHHLKEAAGLLQAGREAGQNIASDFKRHKLLNGLTNFTQSIE